MRYSFLKGRKAVSNPFTVDAVIKSFMALYKLRKLEILYIYGHGRGHSSFIFFYFSVCQGQFVATTNLGKMSYHSQ